MSGDKMNTTNQALILFLKSLPVGSYFEVISFGSSYEVLSKGNVGFEYTDEEINNAINYIKENFQANLGGTKLYNPLQHAFEECGALSVDGKKIFMLTDGEADDADKVREISAKCPENV